MYCVIWNSHCGRMGVGGRGWSVIDILVMGRKMEAVIQYLSVDEAMEIHSSLVARYGGQDGVRDPGLLESLLYRPQTGHYRDVAEMAAALYEAVLVNRPFREGNRRSAFFLADVFLRMNGWQLKTDRAEVDTFLERLEKRGLVRYEYLLPGIRNAIRPQKPDFVIY